VAGTPPPRRVTFLLFLCVFAAQSGLIALSPVMPDVAAEFGVSTAAAGQLRTVAGLAGALASLVLPAAARRFRSGELLCGGAALLALGSLASAAAPSLALLALGQVPVGIAAAVLTATATSAAGERAPASARGSLLGWTLIGSPAAWIVGMPALGWCGGALSWRVGWLALPLVASLAALISAHASDLRTEPRDEGNSLAVALGDPALRRWLLAELLANSAWLGALVYAGSLFAETYHWSAAAVGGVLALAAVAYAAGNLVFRRLVPRVSRSALLRLAGAMAVLVGLFGAVRPTPVVSASLLAVLSLVAGGRTLLGNAYGLDMRPESRLAAMAARGAANQFGAFLGAAIAGAALSAGGYRLFGFVLALEFAFSAVPLMRPRGHARSQARRRLVAVLARAR
jgi:predicted MFS family arabinose efflux permease